MKNILVKVTCCFLILGCCLSCSEVLKPIPLTFYKNFTGDDHKSWNLQFAVFKQDGKGDQKFSLAACNADDQYIFYANTDHTYQVDNNSTSCSPDQGVSDSIADSWSFVNATATLTIIIPAFSSSALQFHIRSINDKQMILEIFTDPDNTSSYQIYFVPTKN